MYYIAQVETGYGCANYGETDAYNSCEVTQAVTTETLPNTGNYAVTSTILGVLLLAAALILFIKRGKK